MVACIIAIQASRMISSSPEFTATPHSLAFADNFDLDSSMRDRCAIRSSFNALFPFRWRPLDNGPVFDVDTDTLFIRDPFDPHLEVVVHGHVGDDGQVVRVQQAAIGDADDAELGV